MIKDVLSSISGVEIYPIVALLIFVSFFVAVVAWTLKLDSAMISEMERIPLDSEEPGAAEGVKYDG